MQRSNNGVGPGLILRSINRCFCRNSHRLSAQQQHLPDGPIILVGNHLCGLDPLLIQAAVNRPLSFLMAREYYQAMWYLRWGFDLVGALLPAQQGLHHHRQAHSTQ